MSRGWGEARDASGCKFLYQSTIVLKRYLGPKIREKKFGLRLSEIFDHILLLTNMFTCVEEICGKSLPQSLQVKYGMRFSAPVYNQKKSDLLVKIQPPEIDHPRKSIP